MAFGTAKCVLFIEVSSFQGVLIREVPLYSLPLHGIISFECFGGPIGKNDTSKWPRPPNPCWTLDVNLRCRSSTWSVFVKRWEFFVCLQVKMVWCTYGTWGQGPLLMSSVGTSRPCPQSAVVVTGRWWCQQEETTPSEYGTSTQLGIYYMSKTL